MHLLFHSGIVERLEQLDIGEVLRSTCRALHLRQTLTSVRLYRDAADRYVFDVVARERIE